MSTQYQPSWGQTPDHASHTTPHPPLPFSSSPLYAAEGNSVDGSKKNYPLAALGLVGALLTAASLFLPYFVAGDYSLSWAKASEFDGSRVPFILAFAAALLALVTSVLVLYMRRSGIAGLLYITAALVVGSNIGRNFVPSSFDPRASRAFGFWLLCAGAFLLLLAGIIAISLAMKTKKHENPSQAYPGQYLGYGAQAPQQFSSPQPTHAAPYTPPFQQPPQPGVPFPQFGMTQQQQPVFGQGLFQQSAQPYTPQASYPQTASHQASYPDGPAQGYIQQGGPLPDHTGHAGSYQPNQDTHTPDVDNSPIHPTEGENQQEDQNGEQSFHAQTGQNSAHPTQHVAQTSLSETHPTPSFTQATPSWQTDNFSNSHAPSQPDTTAAPPAEETSAATAPHSAAYETTQESAIFSEGAIPEKPSAQENNTPQPDEINHSTNE